MVLNSPKSKQRSTRSREGLAHRLRQNWMAKHGEVGGVTQVDDSLTSLNWLQNLNIMRLAAPTPPTSPQSADITMNGGGISPILPNPQNMTGNSSDMRVNPNAVLDMTSFQSRGMDRVAPQGYDFNCMMSPFTAHGVDNRVDYKTNPYVKPPYSYANLICMAMKESKRQKITLAGIYKWITENFMYYRLADPSWQNSIRHNLSLNKCFMKVPRRKDEPGKGGFWRINPEYTDHFVNGVFKKRRSSSTRENVPPVTMPSPPAKRLKRDIDEAAEAVQGLLSPLHDVKVEPEPFSPRSMLAENGTANEQMINWSAILHQDIDVGGIKMKTEDLLDDINHDSQDSMHSLQSIANSVGLTVQEGSVALSPPASDTNSEIGLEDLLGSELDVPLDLTSGSPLDLTVEGVSIRAPEWWNESLTKGDFQQYQAQSGLHTPIHAPSPVLDSHPWAEDRHDIDAMDGFGGLDLQNIFETDKLTTVFPS